MPGEGVDGKTPVMMTSARTRHPARQFQDQRPIQPSRRGDAKVPESPTGAAGQWPMIAVR